MWIEDDFTTFLTLPDVALHADSQSGANDPIRPTWQNPDPNRPTYGSKKGHCDVGALSGGVWSVTFFKLGTGDIFIDGN